MTFMEISHEDQDKIRDFLSYVRVTREHQEDYDEFLTTICPSLKVKVQNDIFTKDLRENAIISLLIPSEK